MSSSQHPVAACLAYLEANGLQSTVTERLGECWLLLVARTLSMSVIAICIFLKLPQAQTILRARSAEGINVPSLLLEILGYSSVITFGWRKELSITVYGELILLLLQDYLVLALILHYTKRFTPNVYASIVLYFAVFFAFLLGYGPVVVVQVLQSSAILISAASKLLQISANIKNQGTGRLSLATLALNTYASYARLTSILIEVDSIAYAISGIISSTLNTVLTLQVIYYAKATIQRPSTTETAKTK
ncbi:hypothetical protein CAOG_02179 [Capsaspora owczarzaki ATCC 30864]|uniref:Mannose-P-dolichol utilization defect 1 protein homolog n=1 Tax=Capsaspora owczarzaki (strain ATCC 30864) TaxID=595528 RepID=A0A0D2WKS7_CAPO3|nr:hypothetical protein CAOG_02179 [Capsaspora owczarzaki ATCC 30864]KJE90960.1 hypothetical protein CAOG_002179 [Capsaspora owczarzaki ATCC 30864]|eukprot:XP_004348929.1 hypothetical protein CAOG_02179 [Capsaspora owczarzaki ATCC 30864]